MNLPKSFFEPGTHNLTVRAKNTFKVFLKTQELSRISDLVGYTPHPTNPCPTPIWPWPRRNIFGMHSNIGDLSGPPWPEPCRVLRTFGIGNNSYPNPDDIDPWPWPWPIGPLVKDFINERIYELVTKSPLRENTYDFIDVIKREHIAIDALSELSDNLSLAQNEISTRLKKVKNQ